MLDATKLKKVNLSQNRNELKSQKYINVSINYDQSGSNDNEVGELFLSNYPSRFKLSLSELLGSPSDEIEENVAFNIWRNQAQAA